MWHGMLSLCSAGDCRAEDAGSELHERGSGHAHCGRHSKEHGREDRDSSGISLQRVAVKGHQVWASAFWRGHPLRPQGCYQRQCYGRIAHMPAAILAYWLAAISSAGVSVCHNLTHSLVLIRCCQEQGSYESRNTSMILSVPPAQWPGLLRASRTAFTLFRRACEEGDPQAGRPDNALMSCHPHLYFEACMSSRSKPCVLAARSCRSATAA